MVKTYNLWPHFSYRLSASGKSSDRELADSAVVQLRYALLMRNMGKPGCERDVAKATAVCESLRAELVVIIESLQSIVTYLDSVLKGSDDHD